MPSSTRSVSPWPIRQRQIRRQIVYLWWTLVLIVSLMLASGMLAVTLQASRDDTRRTDLALVVIPVVPSQAMIDHTLDLYRRGLVPQMLLVGEGSDGLRARLVEQGLSEERIVLLSTSHHVPADLQLAGQSARTQGSQTVLVVAEPADMLTALKIMRDQDLRAYSSPVRESTLDLGTLFRATMRYWSYVLALS
ncbi:YdcF family protein [Candidatus Chloroploca asiatica]|uniref:YdcF family protein n=1 Tax=Candidatus Chloroploca asiatica TaxID=1506545 RepID=UPI0011424596|nr:YdcF family protein [Candidatus Chloroploca asiatica]